MNPNETKLERLFHQVCVIETPEAQTTFLREACGDDADLLAEVQRLVSAHRRAGQFLRSGPEGPGEDGGDGGGIPDGEVSGEDLPSPGRIGDYRILGLIGEGAFSRVYLAEQERPVRRWIALKVIKPGMDTTEVILRFQRERQVLALMDHPGIAKVYDAGATPQGHPYFVMEWVRGLEITEYCDRHRRSISDRLNLFCQVCLAVMHAHQKGVIHRDLKPSNILVSESDGQPCPKVIDFGIAKVTRDAASGTAAATWGASLVGTPAYMSPEQAELGNPDVDTRSDVYSLGALLYELLIGRPPFDARSLAGVTWENLSVSIRPQDPLRPSVRLKRLPAEERAQVAETRRSTVGALCRRLEVDLDWIVLRALEKEREARYPGAAQLVDDIRRHLEHRPVSAAAPSVGYRVRKLVRRNRQVVGVVSLVAVMLLAGVVVSSRLAWRAHSSAVQALESQASAEESEREARRRLIEVNVSAGLAANERGDYDDALLWFAHAALAAEREPRERLVNLLRARNWLAWSSRPVAAMQAPSGLRLLSFDPRGRRLLTLASNHELALWEVPAGTPLEWVREVGPIEAVAWSADGSLVAMALSRGDVEVRRATDGAVVERLPQSLPATAVAFSPDGRYLAHGSRTIALWDLESQSTVMEWPHPEAVREILFARQSQRVVTACLDGLARVFERSPGTGRFEAVGVPLAHRPSIRLDTCDNKTSYHEAFLSEAQGSSLAFLDDGRVLATRSDIYEITLWEISSGRALRRFDHICCSCNFQVNHDGSALACGMHGNVVGVWETETGRPRGAMLPQGGCVFAVAFDPRGDLLLAAGADHNATFWSLQTGERVGPQLHHFNDVMNVAFAADGQWVATAQADGLVRLWSVPTSKWPGHILSYDEGPKRVRLDPSGRWAVAAKEPAWNPGVVFRRTRVYDVASGLPRGPVLDLPGTIQDAAVSSDGRWVAVLEIEGAGRPPGAMSFHEATTSRKIGEVLELPSPPRALCWHPTRAQVAVNCRDGELGVVEAGPEPVVQWLRLKHPGSTRTRYQVEFSPDGERLISLGPAGGVEVWRWDEGEATGTELPAFGGSAWSFALSATGRYLATTTVLGAVAVWDLETGGQASPILSHRGWVYRAAFSADGERLVTACHDGHVRAWEWRTGSLLWQPLDHAEQVLDVAFTPDGRWILTACRDGAVRAWDPVGGGLMMPAVKVGIQALSLELSRDGRYAVVGSLGGPAHAFCLSVLADLGGLGPREYRDLGEVLSSGEIREGKRREFSAAEWLERFRELQRRSAAGLLSPPQAEASPPGNGGADGLVACGDAPECDQCPDRVRALKEAAGLRQLGR